MKPIIDFATAEQKQRLLPRIANGGLGALAITEASAGSDATRMKTRFTPDGDDIIVDGSKIFITNGDVADLYLLFGKWSEIDDDRQSISVLVFEKGTAGFEVVRGSTPPHPTPKNKIVRYGLWGGVLTLKYAEKWCIICWGPGSQKLVTGICKIFNLHEFRPFGKVPSSPSTSKYIKIGH